MPRNPIVSVCIPTFANPTGVQDVIGTLAAQVPNVDLVEFCISDNSEDDRTTRVVQELRTKLPGLHYSQNRENLGYDRNVERVLKMATGNYCWLLSDNETVKEGALTAVMQSIELEPATGLFIICPEDITKDTLVTYPNMEAAMRANNLWIPGGLVSRNVIKRALIPADLEQYFDNDWLHLSVTLRVGGNAPVSFVPEQFAQDSKEQTPWAKDGKTFATYTNLLDILETLPAPPYSTQFIQDVTMKMRRELPRQILSAKLYGLTPNVTVFSKLRLSLAEHPIILVASMFALIVPVPIIKYAKFIRHSFGN
jgi:glycosyltransferase involved in cell wall biosynthesis